MRMTDVTKITAAKRAATDIDQARDGPGIDPAQAP